MKKEWAPQLLRILRIVVAFLYFQVGSAKWFAFPAPILPGGGVAPVGSLIWFAGIIEVVGGTLFLLGLFTRPVAFILSGEMAFAYFIGHAGHGFWPVLNQGAPRSSTASPSFITPRLAPDPGASMRCSHGAVPPSPRSR